MSLRLTTLYVDARDPLALAQFWGGVLQREVVIDSPDDVGLRAPVGSTLDIYFQRDPDPDDTPPRIHLDVSSVSSEAQRATVQRALDLGARHIDIGQGLDATHVVLADPEGNAFCVVAPGNDFTDESTLVGSITCEGSAAARLFWSEALGWPLAGASDGTAAMRAPKGIGPYIVWLSPPPPAKTGKNRLHLDIAPPADRDQHAEVERLISLGASRIDIGQGEVNWVVLADPDGNEFCVLTPR